MSSADRVDLRVNDFMVAVDFKDKLLDRLVEKNGVPYGDGEEEEIIQKIFAHMLYQVGSFHLFSFCRRCSVSMRGKSPEKAL